jgi:hypothetical protein
MLRYVWVGVEGPTSSARYCWFKRSAYHHQKSIPFRVLKAAGPCDCGFMGSLTGGDN